MRSETVLGYTFVQAEWEAAWERATKPIPFLPYSNAAPSVSITLTSIDCKYCSTTLHIYDANCRNCGAPLSFVG
jgi:hypothetical protein